MTIHLRSLFLGSCALVLGCTDPAALDPSRAATQPIGAAVALGATPLAVDANGVPSLVRGGDTMPAMPAATATESARQHLARLAPAWGVRSAAALPGLEAIGEIPVAGGTIVRFRQVLDGLPVESTAGGEMRVMVRADGTLVGASGTLRSTDTPRAAAQLRDDDASAVTRAVNDKYKTALAPAMLATARSAPDGSRVLAGEAGDVHVAMSRARQAWYPQGKALVPAWIVEAYSSTGDRTDGDAYRTVISATGRVLARTNLKADAAFKYRVFADPANLTSDFHPLDGPIVDSSPNTFATPMLAPHQRAFPAYVTPSLVTVTGSNHPASGTPDPWLPATATDTHGNNVDAYTDANPPDGLSGGDFRADATAAGVFDRTYDLTKGALDSTDQQKAGITSLFYLINWMHDFWYDGGFVEAAGNGQDDNYGRGGEGSDAVHAEAQDNAKGPNGGSRNNANMATPSDGMPGRMQVFVWDNDDHRHLTVGGIDYATGTAGFGPTTYNVTGATVIAVDAADPTGDGCDALTAAASGKVVIIDRGKCNFKTKALNAQTAGALGVILANNAPGTPPGMADDATITTPITIPMLSVSQTDSTALKAAAGATAVLGRNPDPDLDGTLDVTVIGHEFGHFVHHRLSSCTTTLCNAMSEGWADFSALLVSSRAGDSFDAQFPLGIYSTRGTSPDPAFYGIRRAPYTTNHAINALMFHHMSVGATLPPAPFDGGDPAGNSEVHNAGEVWASMLWEGYAALQKAGGADNTSFEATRLKMRKYVVAGLLLAPTDATPTETRDAILMAANAASPADHDLLVAAYAKRGFGSCAVSPDRGSTDFTGIVDSTDIKGRADVGELDVSSPTSCDDDGVLDPGETLQIKIPVSNGGPVAMTNVAVTLRSSLVTFADEASRTVSLGTIAPGAQTFATFVVSLAPTVLAPTESDVMLEIASDDGCTHVPVPFVSRFNSDDKADGSSIDGFNAGTSVWVPSHVKHGASDTSEPWIHVRPSGLAGLQFGAELGTPSDASLTSPPLKAGGGTLTMTLTHAFLFETDDSTPAKAFDGGVIEYSLDKGTTWQDISGIASPGYNVTLDATASTTNVLAGRQAFGGNNDGFPNTDTVKIDFGKSLANKSFLLRFRIGTDDGTGGGGWEIDSVGFTGLDGSPFPTLVADPNHCHPSDDGGCCQTAGMATSLKAGNLLAALGVIGLVLRRRRRRAR